MAPLYDGAGDGGAGGQGGNGGAAGAGGTGAAGDGATGAAASASDEKDLEKVIQGRIGAALKSAKKAWLAENPAMSAEERAELETARKEREDLKRKDLEAKGQYEAALKAQEDSLKKKYDPEITAREERINSLTGRLRIEIVTNKLLAAAAAGNAYNAEQVVGLLERQITLDEEWNPVVVEKDGKTPRFIEGHAMTPEQLVQDFLKTNPHMVKAGNTGQGGGAKGGASREGQDLSEIQKLEAELEQLRKDYSKTRDVNTMSLFQKKAMELKAARAKAA